MADSNPYLAVVDSDMITKKYADQTYTSKSDYNQLNSKVQELEASVATLTQTVTTLQSTITQLQGNALTTLDRQTLDVIEGVTS